jgi:putative serine protease PepD
MKPRSSRRTIGAVVLGAGVTLIVIAAIAFTGVVHLPTGRSTPTSAPAPVVPTASSRSTMPADSLSKLYRSVSDGVVYVQSTTDQGTASGSGFVLDTKGDIVTNEHVIDGANAVQVRVGEQGSPVDAQVVGADTNSDVAVLKVDPSAVSKAHPLALGNSDNLEIGQSAVAIGSPFGLQGTLTSGIVSALHRQIQSPSGAAIDGAIQTDAAINPGNSGGPLLNRQGEVVGINAQIASESGTNSGVGFAIPINTVKKVVGGIENGSIGQPDQSGGQQQQVAPDQGGQQLAPDEGGGQQVVPGDGGQQVVPSPGDGSGGGQVAPDDGSGQGGQLAPDDGSGQSDGSGQDDGSGGFSIG